MFLDGSLSSMAAFSSLLYSPAFAAPLNLWSNCKYFFHKAECQLISDRIVFRAFQGIGASGLFSLTMVIVPDITPDKWLGLYSGVVSSVFAFSSVLGPVLGGVLAQHSTWRWVFLLKYVHESANPLPLTFHQPSWNSYLRFDAHPFHQN